MQFLGFSSFEHPAIHVTLPAPISNFLELLAVTFSVSCFMFSLFSFYAIAYRLQRKCAFHIHVYMS